MPRYTKQRDKSRCGPIAILNALRWAGLEISYSFAKTKISKACKWNPSRGTKWNSFSKTLRHFGKEVFKVKHKRYPTLQEVNEHLDKGEAVVLNYAQKHNGEKYRHYVLLINENGCKFLINAYEDSKAALPLNEDELRDYHFFYQNVRGYRLRAWFLTKRRK